MSQARLGTRPVPGLDEPNSNQRHRLDWSRPHSNHSIQRLLFNFRGTKRGIAHVWDFTSRYEQAERDNADHQV